VAAFSWLRFFQAMVAYTDIGDLGQPDWDTADTGRSTANPPYAMYAPSPIRSMFAAAGQELTRSRSDDPGGPMKKLLRWP